MKKSIITVIVGMLLASGMGWGQQYISPLTVRYLNYMSSAMSIYNGNPAIVRELQTRIKDELVNGELSPVISKLTENCISKQKTNGPCMSLYGVINVIAAQHPVSDNK